MSVSVITNLVENHSLILKDSLDEYMCVFDSSILEKYTSQWKYNRNLDTEKIKSIMNVVKNKEVLDTVLHFFWDEVNDKLIAFDGNHRREALIILLKSNISMKVCCYIYKCKEPKNLDKEIAAKFKIINNNSPIPDIYNDILDNLDKEHETMLINKKDIIEKVYENYHSRYKQFYSSSSKCKRPQFNATTFKDLCNNQNFSSFEELVSILDTINKTNKDKDIIRKLSETTMNKCKKYNFYMFI
jgi:hypothetical protein